MDYSIIEKAFAVNIHGAFKVAQARVLNPSLTCHNLDHSFPSKKCIKNGLQMLERWVATALSSFILRHPFFFRL